MCVPLRCPFLHLPVGWMQESKSSLTLGLYKGIVTTLAVLFPAQIVCMWLQKSKPFCNSFFGGGGGGGFNDR